MTKYYTSFLTVLFFMVFSLSSSTQAQWTELTSPTTNSLFSVSIVDNSVAWIGGASGVVLRTTDGGATWTDVGSGTIVLGDVYNIFAIDDQTALCTTSPSATNVYRTTDGGATWTQVFTQAGGFMDAIWMTSATDGIMYGDPVGGNWELYNTTDGGATWTPAPALAQSGTEAGWNNAMYVSGSNIYFGTNNTRIYYSSDGGNSWTPQTTTGETNSYSVWFNSANVGLMGGTGVDATTDGGTTWSPITVPGTAALAGITGTGSDWWVARQSAPGVVYYSSDNGSTWTTDYTTATGAFYHIGKARNGNWILAVQNDGGISSLVLPTSGPEPEMSLTHTPGDLNVGIFNTGAIGTEQINATGPGVTWKGEQGLYMGGVLFGDAAAASVNGVFGSFTSGGGPVINDLRNVESNFAGGFTSDANFDQISTAVLYDSAAPVPYNTEIIQKTYSNTGDDFVFLRYGIINRSGADIMDGYSGIALDWDVGAYATNSGGYALNNHLVYQYDTGPTSSYYFGVIALTDLGGRRATPESAFGPPFSDARLDIYSWITSMSDTTFANGDFRSYISSGPMNYTVDDTVWTTYAIVAGDDLAQITDNGFNASVKAYNLGWTQMVVPVELSSFTANVNSNGQVVLNWSTATEINNRMFEIQRKDANNEYATVGFINGSGTTTEPKEYSFVDKNVNNGTYTYRLKQLDFDGKVSYSNTVDVNVSGPRTFSLAQNYPNPFNPTTTITYSVPQAGKVKLAIYNLLGQEVAVLVNGVVSEGSHQVEFNAKSLPSGAYFYKLQGENSVSVKKMLLLK